MSAVSCPVQISPTPSSTSSTSTEQFPRRSCIRPFRDNKLQQKPTPSDLLFLQLRVNVAEAAMWSCDTTPQQMPSRTVSWDTHVEVFRQPSRSVTWHTHVEVIIIPARDRRELRGRRAHHHPRS
ncbi:hypothetical protein T484DRAFT_1748324 [Baffinella frigidus]|nr:hypothetical protein T484DRAFT_1748324 [Cryptophyta sp. CCMP2293]